MNGWVSEMLLCVWLEMPVVGEESKKFGYRSRFGFHLLGAVGLAGESVDVWLTWA
jgi:hypothetical protein